MRCCWNRKGRSLQSLGAEADKTGPKRSSTHATERKTSSGRNRNQEKEREKEEREREERERDRA